MKTLSDFKAIVARISYKPGWTVEVYETIPGSIFMQVRFQSVDPCVTDVGLQPQSGRKWLLSPHMTDGEVVQTAFQAIKTAEEHEAREFFKLDGRAIFGPHFNLQKLIEICDQADGTEVRKPHNS